MSQTRKTGYLCSWHRLIAILMVLVGAACFSPPALEAQTTQASVVVVPIHGEIDLGLAPYLQRVLAQAAEQNAQAAILDIRTPGGRLDAVLQMRDTLLASPLRTVAFVNREAFSAGALIAIACSDIYMAPGAVMGAATPVDQTGATASEKVISAVRTTFRSTAELRERDPRIAEAMVDPAIEIDGLVEKGQLLTLTTAQAQEVGYAAGTPSNLQELLEELDLAGATVQHTSPTLAEQVVRFLTNPLIASLLISLGFLMLITDLLSGGIGALSLAGIALYALFFWGHMLAGLAGWEGVALVVAGIALIAVEVFVFPGFGVAGLLGIAALLGGLGLSLLGRVIITTDDLVRVAVTIGLSLLLIVVGLILLLRMLPRAQRLRGLILQSQVEVPTGAARSTSDSWLTGSRLEAQMPVPTAAETTPTSLHGATGVALSDLRPGGFARIDGKRVDVVTEGDYIRAGEEIEVVADEGYRRVVRRRSQPPPAGRDSDPVSPA